MCHIFFIHSSVDGHLGCFHVLAIVNSAAMNIVVHVSFWIIAFSGYMPSSEIARSYGRSIFSYHFLLTGTRVAGRNCWFQRLGRKCIRWAWDVLLWQEGRKPSKGQRSPHCSHYDDTEGWNAAFDNIKCLFVWMLVIQSRIFSLGIGDSLKQRHKDFKQKI